MDFVTKLFDSSGFMARRICGKWSTELIAIHNISDALIWLSYIAIPVVLVYFVRRRSDMPFPWIFWLFGAFIVLCGTTHLMEVVMFYWPVYRLAGLIKFATAMVSVSTVIALVPITPVALSMRSPKELEREIADRNRAEAALRESEERFRGTFENAAVGVAHGDADGRLLRVNEKLCDIIGYSREELLARSFQDVTHPDDLALNVELYMTLMRGESLSFSLEKRYIRKDGSLVWVNVSVSLQRDAAGKPAYAIALIQDISERRQAEEALRLANARLDLAVRGSNIGIWEFDMADGAIERSRAHFFNVWEQLNLDRPESPPGFAAVMALVHPDDRERLEHGIRAYLSGETGEFEVEHRARRKDGSYRWMLARGVAMRDPAGRPIRFIGSSIDITDHRSAEEALCASEERFRGTFENAAVGIAHKDAQGRWLRVNAKYCEIVGYDRDELLQRTFHEITHPEDLAAELEKYTPLMRGELPHYSLEKRYVRKDGSPIWSNVTISLERDSAGNPAYAIAILQDISERKRLEEESREAKEAAEAANRAKDEFLANVSHEIRTPMNAILGITELVLDTPLTEDQRQCLETVMSAADNLLGVINDLLDFSKIAAGKLELDPADFSLQTATGDTLRALAERAHIKGLELICNVHPDVPDALVGDAGRLRQVLLNLVGNAIKFTERGEVVISVAVTTDPDLHAEVELRFVVRDTGIGISHDKQETIFQAFEQEDTSTTRRYGGTGLGLTIASRLVGLMGGKIRVESEAGRGSAFSFTARFGLQSQPSEPPGGRSLVRFHNLPVLIVDDNATNRYILEEWLRGWQMEPTSVGDGASAMDALWHGIALGRPFALVILDACMPVTSGLSLAAMIRDRAELAATRIILLSSGEPAGDRARSRELQIDAQLLKPVPQNELLGTIYRVMSRTNGTTPPVRETVIAPSPSVAPLRILVVEDNEFNRRHLERLLARRSYDVRLATNGREALALLGVDGQGAGVRNPETETGGGTSSPSPTPETRPLTTDFDLMLLDLHMPQLDGFQVIRAIREREQAAGGHLPVIALTARSRQEDRESCLAAGMDEYLSKPIRAAEMFATIDRMVADREVSAPHQAEIADGASLLDPVVLLASCGDDEEGLRGLCEDFRSYAPARLAEVVEALRVQDAPRLREAAHKLRGLLSVFSTMADDVASNIEDQAALGRLDGAQSQVRQLESMARRLTRQIDGLSCDSLRRQAEAISRSGSEGV